jgi:hypothetical protein
MRQPQSGFVDPTRMSGLAPVGGGEFDRAVSFRFIVSWSSLSRTLDSAAPHGFPVVHPSERSQPAVAPAPRVMPAPQPAITQPAIPATPLNRSVRTLADEAVPGGIKKTRSARGIQWEMVVPKMVRTAKKPPPPSSPRPVSSDPAASTAIPAEQPFPNLYTTASSFRKSVSFKLCVGVLAVAAVSVPLWKRVARPAAAEIETPIAGGDWQRESAVAGDPGAKQSRQLVIYRPSLKSADCRLDFDWTVSSGDAGLIFRAQDLGNYYAVRLKILKPGPAPTLSAEHFSVYHFTEGPHSEKVLVFSRNDPVLHVRLEIAGPTFTLYLQNNAAEYWTDAKLATGAVGFLEEWHRSPDVHNVRMLFPQRTQAFRAAPIPGLRELLARYEPRALPGTRPQAMGGL